MKKILILFILFSGSLVSARNVELAFSDNSDNEDGFEVRGRLASGVWEVVSTLPENVTQVEVDPQTHEAWQVFAFNEWGYSDGTNVLEKDLPNPAGELRIKKQTVTEQITRTTVTEYQLPEKS